MRKNFLLLINAFLCAFIWSGCGYYSFSLFVSPLQGQFGWERGSIMAAFTISFLLSGLLSPAIGTAIHRWGLKWVLVISTMVFSGGFAGLATIHSITEFYIYSGLMGLGMAGVGPVAASTIITQYFQENRGHAIGIMSAGIGLGGMVLSPVIGGWIIPELGWQMAYILLAGFSLLALIPITLLALGSIKIPATAQSGNENGIPVMAPEGVTLRQALHTRSFWLIIIVVFMLQISQTGAVQNQVPYMNDMGFPASLSALCLGIIGMCSAAGKYVFGWLCDRIRANYASLTGMAFQIAALLILINIHSSSPAVLLIIYAVVMGIGNGSWLPTMSMMTSENLGVKEYARIFGVMSVGHALGTALGPLLPSLAYDRLGDYQAAFLCLLAFYAVAVPAAFLIHKEYGNAIQIKP